MREEGELTPDEAAEEGRSPEWLSAILSGAKRVFSSVLFSSFEEQLLEEEEKEEEEREGRASRLQRQLQLRWSS